MAAFKLKGLTMLQNTTEYNSASDPSRSFRGWDYNRVV